GVGGGGGGGGTRAPGCAPGAVGVSEGGAVGNGGGPGCIDGAAVAADAPVATVEAKTSRATGPAGTGGVARDAAVAYLQRPGAEDAAAAAPGTAERCVPDAPITAVTGGVERDDVVVQRQPPAVADPPSVFGSVATRPGTAVRPGLRRAVLDRDAGDRHCRGAGGDIEDAVREVAVDQRDSSACTRDGHAR